MNHVIFDPANFTNIKQISDSDFYFLRDVLSWVSSTSDMRKQKFTYGMKFTNHLTPPSGVGMAGWSSAVSVTLLENYRPMNNPTSPLPNLPNEPDYNPDPNSSDYSSSGSYNSSNSREIK